MTAAMFFALIQESLAQSNLKERPRRTLLPFVGLTDLTPADRELAEQLEIWQLLLELHNKENPPNAERKIVLRNKIRETVMESYFDTVSFEAEAEREQAVLVTLRDAVTALRDRKVDINNAVNFIASGTLNTVGSVLGFSDQYPAFSGNLNQMLSGVVSTGMSGYALKQTTGGKVQGKGSPTVIAELFGRPTDDRTSYPESVWRYFHCKSIDIPDKTRAQELEDYWIEKKHLEPHGSRREALKLDFVSGVALKGRSMSINDLNDQIAMIGDISAAAARMARHLRDLLAMVDSDLN